LDIEFGVGYGKFANSENVDAGNLILAWPKENIQEKILHSIKRRFNIPILF
jgi:hypothetical protein